MSEGWWTRPAPVGTGFYPGCEGSANSGAQLERRSGFLVGRFAGFQVPAVIHPIVEHATDKNAGLVRFKEYAMTAAGGYQKDWV